MLLKDTFDGRAIKQFGNIFHKILIADVKLNIRLTFLKTYILINEGCDFSTLMPSFTDKV